MEVECPLTENRQREAGRQIAESQLSELQNTRVLLEEARGLSRNLAYHRRARLVATIGGALDKVHRQIVMIAPAQMATRPIKNGTTERRPNLSNGASTTALNTTSSATPASKATTATVERNVA